MRALLCNSSSTFPISAKPSPFVKQPPNNWISKTLKSALTGVLSIGLIVSSPSPFSIALELSSVQVQASSPEICQGEEDQAENSDSRPVTNQQIVEEAWQIVNDSFLDAGRHGWTSQNWQQKREDMLATSIQTRSKAHDMIRKMLASLGDPYTRFLSPAELNEYRSQDLNKIEQPCLELYTMFKFSKMARYDMTGIGINLREVPDDNGSAKLKVLGLLLDGPAHTAGVRQGDEILFVNGMDVKGKSAFEVSSMLLGPSETYVTIKVKHGNCGPIRSIEVQRQMVARTPVFYRLEQINNGMPYVGYVRLKEFNALARKDLVIAMERLQDMGASYFVLDLRDNLGGLVQAGIEVAKLFLNEGDTVINTVGRDNQYQITTVTNTVPLVKAPVIVLVNNKTASASEIVASALHDNCRAVLVGDRTYGKGLIQSVFELDDGSGVVVTVGKYVTPNHVDINGNGIQPDFKNFPGWNEVSRRLSKCSVLEQ